MSEETLPRQLGRYRLLRRIGKGSMATVYRAVLEGPHGFENEVAIKLVHAELLAAYPKVVKMAVDEARIAARLHHPNIVRILDLVEEEGCFYMVMDYVDGVSMRVVLDAAREVGGLPPLGPVLEVLAAACDGLQEAHGLCRADGTRLNLVHRDVKPDNIMVSTDGEVKVGDFGIATFVDRMADATAQGQLKGTPAYMAPEQTLGGPLDARTDLFSMGLTLYTLATTELAFRAKKPVGVALKIARESLEPHADKLDALLPGLGDVFRTACARDPDKRFSDAAAMAEALRELHASITGPQTIAAMLQMSRQLAEDDLSDPLPETITSGATDDLSDESMGPGRQERAGGLPRRDSFQGSQGTQQPSLTVGVRPDTRSQDERSVQDTDPAQQAQLDAQVTDPTDRFSKEALAEDPTTHTDNETNTDASANQADPETTDPFGGRTRQDAQSTDPSGQAPPGTGGLRSTPNQDAPTRPQAPVVSAPNPPAGGGWTAAQPPPPGSSPTGSPGTPAQLPGPAMLAPRPPAGAQTTASTTSVTPDSGRVPGAAQALPERDYRGRVVRRVRSPENTHVGSKEKLGVAAAVGGLALVIAVLIISLLAAPGEKAEAELPVQTPADLGLGPLGQHQGAAEGPRPGESLPQQPRSRFLSQKEAGSPSQGAAGDEAVRRSQTAQSREQAPAKSNESKAQDAPLPKKQTARPPAPKSLAAPQRAAQAEGSATPALGEDPTPAFGTITVNSYPWSRIYIDGTDIGRTPLKARAVEVGVHTVELVFPTAENKRFSKRVEVRPDRDVRIVHRLPEDGNE